DGATAGRGDGARDRSRHAPAVVGRRLPGAHRPRRGRARGGGRVTSQTIRRRNLAWAANDTWVLTWRNVTVWRRVPAYLVFTIIQPMIFTLLFRYVFGGAIPSLLPGGYVEFLIPGVIGQTAAFATMATAISLAIEAQKGVI